MARTTSANKKTVANGVDHSTLPERVSVLETRVANLDEKIDEIKDTVKELHVNLDDTKVCLTQAIKELQQDAHAAHENLTKKIEDLNQFKTKWMYLFLGGMAVLGFISGHAKELLSLLK